MSAKSDKQPSYRESEGVGAAGLLPCYIWTEHMWAGKGTEQCVVEPLHPPCGYKVRSRC